MLHLVAKKWPFKDAKTSGLLFAIRILFHEFIKNIDLEFSRLAILGDIFDDFESQLMATPVAVTDLHHLAERPLAQCPNYLV